MRCAIPSCASASRGPAPTSNTPGCSTTAPFRRSSRASPTGPRCHWPSCSGAISRRRWPTSPAICSDRRRSWPREDPTRSTAARGTACTCSSGTRRSVRARPKCRRTSSATRPSSCPDGDAALKLGLITPVLTLNPRVHNSWEETAPFDAVVAVAEAADRLGYHHITCSEHIAVPAGEIAARRGSRYYDPLATFGYLAARTTTIRFETHVLVLGYHHPFALAKQYGTLDAISDGRLILGVGVGSLEEEFALLGAPFAD